MRDSIAKKLQAAMDVPVDSECKVVYILCETRKLLDEAKPKTNPVTLRLYCNWAVHVDLDHPGTTIRFLEKVDEFVARLEKAETTETIQADTLQMREFVYWEALRKELCDLLESYQVAPRVCKDDALWFQFLEHLCGVLDDGSLSCSGANQLKRVQKVTFAKGRPHPEEKTHLPFAINWNISIKPGNKFKGVEVDVSADKEAKFVAWGVKVFP